MLQALVEKQYKEEHIARRSYDTEFKEELLEMLETPQRRMSPEGTSLVIV